MEESSSLYFSRSASEKPAQVSSKEPISTSIVDTPFISGPVSGTVSGRIENSSFEKGEATILASEGQVSSLLNKKKEDKPSDIGILNDTGKITLEQAAIIVQAFFRGCQARNEFQILKGAIRLQAAVRGHLVRRQAVGTLFCMKGIVRFQAITRGYMVRQASAGNGHCRKQSPLVKDVSNQDSCEIKYSRSRTLSKNAFIYELLASSRAAMPLRLEYSPGDSNSAWSWLHRWSTSQSWAPNVEQKETGNSKLQKVETEQIKSKRNGRRASSVTVRKDPNYANAEPDIKLIGRKLTSHSVKSAQEHPQFENGKVKSGVKKNQKPIGEICNEETDVSKPRRHQRKLLKAPAPKSLEQTSNTLTSKSMEDLAEPEAKVIGNRSQDILPLEKDFRDEETSSENYKSSQTTSIPVKHDDQDATPESMTRVPSYMATTASSQAKVKAQASARFEQYATERTALTRRYSLPSSIGGKLISSPRVHKLVQSNGKEGTKIDRSLSSSREIADMANHVDWKR
ncbi:protein IQ-DOMAIN 28-like isoform X2 [Salvia miltiorrhiza]|uniref:protein IQ-DOMAIN 28-like isoform X2 n=1 Tax=Salvia miltiorrhiza TaxID=226208 RepID=UPI0025ABDCF7|nr:protein IQ-DOMAIN 28-like isoform X2 [Salvia miltiorrhiza]